MSVKTTVDSAKPKAKIFLAAQEAEQALAEQVLNDANEFIPVDQGTLRDSGRVKRMWLHHAVVWNTPYAKIRWYTGRPKKDKNPKASKMWAIKAKQQYRQDWQTVLQNAFNARLNK